MGCGAIIHRRGRLLLVRRAEEPAYGTWSFPGGGVEPGESLEETAIREVKEEVGLDIEIERVFEVVVYPSSRGLDPFLVVDYLAKAPRGKVKINSESSDWGWFRPEEVEGLDADDKVKSCARKFAGR